MFLFLAYLAVSSKSSLNLSLKATASCPNGCNGWYAPGPGFPWSAVRFSGFITVLVKASLPVPKQKVFGPLHITAKVEVVLFGLKSEGMLYLSGGGDFELPKAFISKI